jgi:GT2 family glycosyltransferase
MLPPIASVVIPTCNRPQALHRCLLALASQTMPSGAFEVIIVDDGSDQALTVDPAQWASKFKLKLIRQHNTGPAGARNRGVAEAQGDFLAFTDDDCLPSPTWLQKLIAELRDHPEAMVGGATLNGLTDDLFAETSQLILEMVYCHFNQDPSDAYFFASNNLACAKESFNSLGGFDTSFREASEDREWCDRWRINQHPLRWVPDATIEHQHPQDLLKFTKLHFRYGKGAHRYRQLREIRNSGNMTRDLGFHRRIPSLLWNRRGRYHATRLAGIACLLMWWEVVNLAGFCSSRFMGD